MAGEGRGLEEVPQAGHRGWEGECGAGGLLDSWSRLCPAARLRCMGNHSSQFKPRAYSWAPRPPLMPP